ncbi:hypothetical protein GH714_023820 [Hevea brasiliensis]|uniref:Uncharacterized protein n=1 Tax=Hevea brasiliensis TaxID=3981 RepID=A0A6A6MVF6_HEVBR|nr:hypothetical protein GH714_023820 [Hevea brasiliensis]
MNNEGLIKRNDLDEVMMDSVDSLQKKRSSMPVDEGFERLESLNKLEFLDLDRSWFNNMSILSSIGHLSSLKSLSLAYIGLESVTDIQGLSRLENLEFLDLSYNNFNDSIFPSLKSLNLAYNRLESVTNFQGLSKLEKLEFIDLSHNNFNSSITPFFSDLSSLRSLYLWDNILTGTIDIKSGGKELQKLSNLEYLDLSYNRLDNNSLSSLRRLSSLKFLNMEYNLLEGLINMEDMRLVRNLSALFLDNITTHGRSSIQLELLGAYPFLKTLSLTDNSFKGAIFAQGSVEELFLDHSSLDEESFKSFGVLPFLKFLSMKALNATLPIQGEIPIQLCNLGQLSLVDLSNNNLSGHVLPCITAASNKVRQEEVGTNPYMASSPAYMKQPLEFTTKSISYYFRGSILNVAHNNLSGKTPEMVAQFATFDNSSYEGNPFLCGPPLSKSCFSSSIMPRVSEEDKKDHKRDGGFMDMDAFYERKYPKKVEKVRDGKWRCEEAKVGLIELVPLLGRKINGNVELVQEKDNEVSSMCVEETQKSNEPEMAVTNEDLQGDYNGMMNLKK